MALTLQIKRGLAANLSKAGVVAGELKYATDTEKLYIGTGEANVLLNPTAPDDTAAHDIKFEMNEETYVITTQLKDKDGNLIGTEKTIDLPLESMVVNVEYVDAIPEGQPHAGEKGLKITLKNGTVTYVPVGAIISGLVSDTRKVAGHDLKTDVEASDIEAACKELAATYKNKTIDADNNTLSNIDASMFKASVAGTGLSIASGVLNHSNSVTAVTSENASLAKIAYDAQGHITAGTAIGLNTAIATTPSDTAVLTEKAVDTALAGKVNNTITVAGVPLTTNVSATDIAGATKEVSVTLKNKSISATDNTISDLSGANFGTGKIGAGLQVNATSSAIEHSNAVTAVSTATMAKFTYDAQGHITGSSAVALNTSIGATPSDTAVLSEKAVDTALSGKVDNTIKVAGKALTADVTAADIDDACKAVTTTFTNKTIDAANNTISNLNGGNFGADMIGAGLQVNSTTNAIEHSNAVTAVSTQTLAKVAYDAQGHITGSTALGLNTAMGASPADTNVLTEKAVSDFVTSGTVAFTNKTFDANGTGNSLSNVELADMADGVVQTTVRAVASAADTSVATEKAVATELAKKVDIAQGTANADKLLQVNASGDLALVNTIDCGTFNS